MFSTMQNEKHRLPAKDSVSWTVADSLLHSGNLTIDQLYDTAVKRGLFPLLTRPSSDTESVSEKDLSKAKTIFSRLLKCVISALGPINSKLSPTQLCRIVEKMCTGKPTVVYMIPRYSQETWVFSTARAINPCSRPSSSRLRPILPRRLTSDGLPLRLSQRCCTCILWTTRQLSATVNAPSPTLPGTPTSSRPPVNEN